MKVTSAAAAALLVVSTCLVTLSTQKVLDLSSTPDLTRDAVHQQRQLLNPRSVNLSFFVPAFSLFALASQFMPQMFPSLTTTTSSRKRNAKALQEPHPPAQEFTLPNTQRQ